MGITGTENAKGEAGMVGESWKAADHEQNEFLRQGCPW